MLKRRAAYIIAKWNEQGDDWIKKRGFESREAFEKKFMSRWKTDDEWHAEMLAGGRRCDEAERTLVRNRVAAGMSRGRSSRSRSPRRRPDRRSGPPEPPSEGC